MQELYIPSFDQTRLFVEIQGSGPETLVLCDGLGCSGFIWKRLMPFFTERLRVVHPHYRGHGQSDRAGDGGLSIGAMVKDVMSVIDHLGLSRVILAGHSLGVQVVLQAAVDHPERVRALIPMCGSYGRPLDTFHNRDWAAQALPYLQKLVGRFPKRAQQVWSLTLGSELSYQIGSRFEINGRVVPREDFKPYFDHMAQMSVAVFTKLLEDMSTHSVEDRLRELTAPTLIVAGDHDSFTPSWLSRRMEADIKGSELLMIPGGTHVAPLEVPELVQLRCERFLERLASPPTDAPKPRRKKNHKQVEHVNG